MRRFTTEPLTGADLRKDATEGFAWAGEKAHLNPETFEIWTYDFNNNLFSKGPSVEKYAKSRRMTYSRKILNRNISKNTTTKKD
jgi:hypothetical protein